MKFFAFHHVFDDFSSLWFVVGSFFHSLSVSDRRRKYIVSFQAFAQLFVLCKLLKSDIFRWLIFKLVLVLECVNLSVRKKREPEKKTCSNKQWFFFFSIFSDMNKSFIFTSFFSLRTHSFFLLTIKFMNIYSFCVCASQRNNSFNISSVTTEKLPVTQSYSVCIGWNFLYFWNHFSYFNVFFFLSPSVTACMCCHYYCLSLCLL